MLQNDLKHYYADDDGKLNGNKINDSVREGITATTLPVRGCNQY